MAILFISRIPSCLSAASTSKPTSIGNNNEAILDKNKKNKPNKNVNL